MLRKTNMHILQVEQREDKGKLVKKRKQTWTGVLRSGGRKAVEGGVYR